MTFRQLIESKGYTAITLSKASQVNIRTIHRYMALGGVDKAYPYNRKCIAKALGMKEKDMMEVLK